MRFREFSQDRKTLKVCASRAPEGECENSRDDPLKKAHQSRAESSEIVQLEPGGAESHCFFRFAVQFTTRVRKVFCSLGVLNTNFFPSGVTS